MKNIIYEFIKKNNRSETLVYLNFTRVSHSTNSQLSKEKISPTLFISVKEFAEDIEEQEKGVKVILQEDIGWLRCDIKSISLLPVVLASQKATEENAVEAILVRDGLITEGTHTNFFAIKDETVFTAPKSKLILMVSPEKLFWSFVKNSKLTVVKNLLIKTI